MNLKLAITSSCTDTGCQVQFLDNEDWTRADYSKPLLQHRIAIHPGDLVAVDCEADSLQVVYRLVLATVVGLEGDEIFADTPSGVHQLALAAGVEAPTGAGSEIFFDQGQVLAVSRRGRPTNPEHLRATLFPKVGALYQSFEE